MSTKFPLARATAAVLSIVTLSGCAGDDREPARQTSMIPPQTVERSEPAGTAFVAALDALALGSEAFGPPQDRRSQPPGDEAFRQAARDADAGPVGR